MWPVDGENAKTPLVEAPVASRPPAIRICLPSVTATSRWTGAGNWCGARTNFTDAAVVALGDAPLGVAEVGGTPDALGDSGDMFDVQAASATVTTGIHHHRRMPLCDAIWAGA